jgi:filamentous hemagglutinin family protein
LSCAPKFEGVGRWLVLCGLSLCSASSYAQVATNITPDATLPVPSSVAQSGATFDINAGTPVGGNLFHSFSQFDVGTGATANFNVPSGTANVLSRVTGGSLSQIDGTLTVTDLGTGGLSTTNLFLLNPAGILFGENAQLNLAGSFHASTADYLKLGTDGIFYANPALGSDVLTMSPPAAFGFLNAPPGPSGCPNACIEVQSSAGDGLRVVNDQTLSLVGGPIIIGTADGTAPGRLLALDVLDPLDAGRTPVAGRINLVSVATAGEAPFDGRNIDVDAFTELGDIQIQRNSIIDAREIFIRAGQLQIDNALVFPGGIPAIFRRYTPPDGGEVNIKTNDLTVSGSASIVGPGGAFTTGIRTQSGSADEIGPSTDAADITIEADSVTITGRVTVRSNRLGPGNAADITVNADSITISTGGSLSVANFYAGSGGNVVINAQQMEIVSSSGRIFTGIGGQAVFHPGWGGGGFSTDPALTSAKGATITINVSGGLTLRHGTISTEARSLGNAGSITINAGDIFLSEDSAVASQSTIAGDSATIRLNVTGRLDINTGSRITTNTLGSGDAGVVEINAGQSINLAGNGAISGATVPVPDAQLDEFATAVLGHSATFADLVADLGLEPATADIFDVLNVLNGRGWTAVADLAPGDAGTISATTPELALSDGATISTTTVWDGNAGAIEATVDNVSLSSGARITSRSGDIRLGQVSIGTGNAGDVSLNATDTILISDTGSIVSTTTFGDGNAGSVSLNANKVNVQSGGKVTSESGGTLAGQSFAGTGNAGTVDVASTGSISVSGAEISTTTFGEGNGGDVTLDAANEVQIIDGGSLSADSLSPDLADVPDKGLTGQITVNAGNQIVMTDGSISTRAVTADGGDIVLNAPNIINLLNSQITTSVESGQGGGGNINVDPQFLILNNSQITANAFGGPGGNITLTADNFIPSADSTVQASSALSTQGTIVIQSPENDIAGSISQLPQSIVDVSGLLPERCAARHAGAAQSSFVVAGPGGLPTNPDNYLPSFSAGSAPLKTGDTTSPTMSRFERRYVNGTAVAMAGWGCRR